MTQEPPFSNFILLSESELQDVFGVFSNEEMRNEYITNASQNLRMFLEVDLKYPFELNDCDDDYPLANELLEVTAEYHSDKHLQLIRKYYSQAASMEQKARINTTFKTKLLSTR